MKKVLIIFCALMGFVNTAYCEYTWAKHPYSTFITNSNNPDTYGLKIKVEYPNEWLPTKNLTYQGYSYIFGPDEQSYFNCSIGIRGAKHYSSEQEYKYIFSELTRMTQHTPQTAELIKSILNFSLTSTNSIKKVVDVQIKAIKGITIDNLSGFLILFNTNIEQNDFNLFTTNTLMLTGYKNVCVATICQTYADSYQTSDMLYKLHLQDFEYFFNSFKVLDHRMVYTPIIHHNTLPEKNISLSEYFDNRKTQIAQINDNKNISKSDIGLETNIQRLPLEVQKWQNEILDVSNRIESEYHKHHEITKEIEHVIPKQSNQQVAPKTSALTGILIILWLFLIFLYSMVFDIKTRGYIKIIKELFPKLNGKINLILVIYTFILLLIRSALIVEANIQTHSVGLFFPLYFIISKYFITQQIAETKNANNYIVKTILVVLVTTPILFLIQSIAYIVLISTLH